VDAEIPSPSAGVLKEIKVTEGQTVPIQTIVAVIDAADGAAKAGAAPKAEAAPKPEAKAPAAGNNGPSNGPSAPASTPANAAPGSPGPAAKQGAASSGTVELPLHGGEPGSKVRSSPLVRRMAREANLDLSQVAGTGAGGRVSKQDLQSALEGGTTPSGAPAARPASAPPPPPSSGGAGSHGNLLDVAVPRERMYFGQYEVQPLSVMRQKIAEHMVLSKRTSPHVYSVEEVDVSAIAKLRNQMKEKFEEQAGTKLTFMPFFIRAAVEALRAYPTVNASLDGTNMVLHKECNIGVAVALDWGLIVPVIKNAEEKNFLGLARSMNDLALRARTKKLKPDEVAESTFSITNPGVYGGLFGLPVINQPNVAILGMGAIEKRPVVIDDAIAIRSMCYLTLSYDHRVVDGAVAHQFMGKIKHTLEEWSESIL
jgi:2-oxoglutarate dehydrogenase E2 component (dihydrolipoamide succinyltransferase)